MQLQPINASASPEVQANENFETLSAAGIFGKRQPVTLGLTWGYYGGRYNGNTVADGTVALTDDDDNYVVVLRATGVVSVDIATTDWDDPAYARLYKVTCAGGVVTAVVDSRQDVNGLSLVTVGGLGYTAEDVVNKDASGGYVGKTLEKHNFWNAARTFLSFFTNANTAARTYTFPDKNGTVAMTSDLAALVPLFTYVTRAATQSCGNGAAVVVSFDTEVTDTAVAYSAGTPTKIIVPSGFTKVRLTAAVAWASNSTNNRALVIKVGATVVQQVSYKAFSTSDMPAITPIIACTAGDEFTLEVFQDSGISLNFTAWLQAEFYA
jgi:hypothetical protein